MMFCACFCSVHVQKWYVPATSCQKPFHAGLVYHGSIIICPNHVRSSCNGREGSLELRLGCQVVQDMLAESQVMQPVLDILLPSVVLGDVALCPPLHLPGLFKVPHFCACQK